MSEAAENGGAGYKEAVIYGMCAMAVTVPLVFSQWFTEYGVPKMILFQTLVVALGAILLIGMVLSGEVYVLDTTLNYTLLGFLAINFISLFQSYNVFNGLFTLFHYVCYFSIVLLLTHTLRSRREIHLLCGAMTATGCVVAFIGLLQHNQVTQFYHAWGIPVSTIGNANFVAQYYNAIFPVALTMLVSPKRAWMRAGALVACFLMACHLVVLGSRGGWLGVAVSLALMGGALASRHFHYGRRVLDAAVTCVVVVGLAWPVTRTALAAIPIGDQRNVADLIGDSWDAMAARSTDALKLRDFSSQQRVLLWEDTVRLVLDHPVVGVGVGNYEFNIPQYMSRRSLEVKRAMEGARTELMAFRAHNEYLEIWAETGIIGFAVFCFLLYQVGRAALDLVRKYVHGDESVLVLGIAAGFAATLVHSFFSTNLQDPASAVHFWMLVGVIWHLKEADTGENRLGLLVTGSGRFAFGMIASLVVSVCAVAWFGVRMLVGDYYYHRGMQFFRREAYIPAEAELERAVAYRPPSLFAAYELLGKSRYNQGEFEGAADALSLSLAQHRTNASAFYYYGQALGRLGRIEEGLPALKRASELNPLRTQYRVGYGIGLSLAGENDAAVLELEQARDLDPSAGDTYFHLGGAYRRAGRFAEAATALQKALEISPNNEEYLNSLAVLNTQRGRFEEAQKVFRRLAGIRPDVPDYRFNLAVNLFSRAQQAGDEAGMQAAVDSVRTLAERFPAFVRGQEFLRLYDTP